jgi:prophage antirepressor-like protein
MPDSNSVAIFSYLQQDVRTVLVNGEPWFVVADVCRVLGLTNPSMATSSLDDDDLSTTEVIDSMRRMQSARIVNESGLYELVFQSRRPEAKQFRRWITTVVLPQIRQTGSYVVDAALPHDYLTALEALVQRERQNVALSQENAELTPRAEAWNAIVSAEGDYSVGDAAKILARAGIQTGPTRLFRQLEHLKWTFRGSDQRPRAYAERVEKGYLTEKPSFHYHPGTGERVIDPPQVRVTVKGLGRLRQRLHTSALTAVS